MKKHSRIGGYFIPRDDDHLVFESANALKGSVLMMFYILFGLMIISVVFGEIVDFFRGNPSLYNEILKDEERSKYLILLFPFIPALVWIFLPNTLVSLDRLKGVVQHKQGRHSFDFPWHQVQFSHQWFPTKTGGATLFTLKATPPFPEALEKMIEKKKRRLPMGQVYTFNLGSFDVKGSEHGQAIFAFLDTWMRSRESAQVLYESMVQTRFGA